MPFIIDNQHQLTDVWLAGEMSRYWDRPHILRTICLEWNAQHWFW